MTALAPARAGRRARLQLTLILGGLTAFAPLSIDMAALALASVAALRLSAR